MYIRLHPDKVDERRLREEISFVYPPLNNKKCEKEKKKFKGCVTLLLCLIMIGIGALPTYASIVKISSFSGTITDSSKAANLSGIEIKVYSAVFVDEEDENALDYYAETYAFSVYTDENGAFSFTKPTTYCSISVELASLPSGYGISQRTQFIRPQRNEFTFSISPIASIDTKLSGDEIEVTLLNEDGAPILAEYTVHEDSPIKLGTVSSASQIFQTYKSSLASVDAMESYTYTGTVTAPGFTAPYSETVDLSDWATDSKVDFLYTKGILTEEEQMEYYCDILSSDEYSVSGDCGTHMIGKLTEYINSPNVRANTVNTDIIASFLRKDRSSSYGEPYTLQILGTKYSLYTFYIYYVEGQIDDDVLDAFVEEIENVYLYFVETNKFNAPTSDPIALSYNIYLTDISGASGLTYSDTINGTSYIELDRTLSPTDVRHSFAHEFQHAIMHEYGIPIGIWAHEAFATMASVVYAGYDASVPSGYAGKLRGYLNNMDRSLFEYCDPYSDNFNYGAMVFPLYICENLGGWTTIRNIYANYSTTGDIFSAIDLIPQISNHGNVFNGCSTYNYYPKLFYSALASYLPKCGVEPKSGATTLSKTLPSMSCKHYEFTLPQTYDEDTDEIYYGSPYSLDFTIQNTTGDSGIMLNVLKWDGENSSSVMIQTLSVDVVGQYTFTQENIGSGNVAEYVLLPVHTDSSGTDIALTLVANYCQ